MINPTDDEMIAWCEHEALAYRAKARQGSRIGSSQRSIDQNDHSATRLSAIAARLRAGAPAGYVVVPREPTLEMLDDGHRAARSVRVSGVSGMTLDAQLRAQTVREAAAYHAMLAAAPSAPRETRTLTPDEASAFNAALRSSVKVVATSVTTEQQRDIAEAWRVYEYAPTPRAFKALEKAIRAAGLLAAPAPPAGKSEPGWPCVPAHFDGR